VRDLGGVFEGAPVSARCRGGVGNTAVVGSTWTTSHHARDGLHGVIASSSSARARSSRLSGATAPVSRLTPLGSADRRVVDADDPPRHADGGHPLRAIPAPARHRPKRACAAAGRPRHSGILEQVKYQERPTRYEYKLTPMGRDLWSVLTLLRQWGDTWLAPDGPPIVSFHTCCGQVAAAELVCSFCREPLRTRSCSCNTALAHPRDEPSRRRTQHAGPCRRNRPSPHRSPAPR
jgi:hypothetical protein